MRDPPQTLATGIVLVVAIRAAAPSRLVITKVAIVQLDIRAHQTWQGEFLVSLGTDQMSLGPLGESGIGFVAGEVAQSGPLEDERAEACDGVVDVAESTGDWVEDDFIVWNTAWCVKCDTEPVCENDCCFQEIVPQTGIFDEVFVRARK
ncbi:hypothetical protein HG530_001279 [Fusarium avenaceum]|nr:hypothetical protein HG530_001279 [Fusarium avenaceum]